MSSEWIIGALALVTIGLVAAIAVYHFGTFLKDPRNRGAAYNALVKDGKSATTRVGEEAKAGEHANKPLQTRLDESQASQHPADPARM